jgi:hypothetical protein
MSVLPNGKNTLWLLVLSSVATHGLVFLTKATVRNLAAWMMFRKVTVEQFVAILADAPTGETAENETRSCCRVRRGKRQPF